jgi:sortase A
MWQERPVLRDNLPPAPARISVAPVFHGPSAVEGTPAAASSIAPAAVLLLLERALLLIGVVLLGWYALQQLQIAYDQAAAAGELEEVRMAAPAPPMEHAHSPLRLSLTTGAVVGRVEIPRVGVSAIVREGDDVKTLRRAVGHVPGTALPGEIGNAALAGHRDTFFRGLRNIRNGDEIRLATPGGDARYVVRSTRIVDPSEVSVLAPTRKSTLTLVTCYPFNYIGTAPKRFIVRAELAN